MPNNQNTETCQLTSGLVLLLADQFLSYPQTLVPHPEEGILFW